MIKPEHICLFRSLRGCRSLNARKFVNAFCDDERETADDKAKKSICLLRRTRAKRQMLQILHCYDCHAERRPWEGRGRSFTHRNLSSKVQARSVFTADVGRRCTFDDSVMSRWLLSNKHWNKGRFRYWLTKDRALG